jgi:cytochrome c oxidase subunit 2
MFSNASSFVEGVDFAFFVIIGISLVFLVGITAAMIYFVIKYNKKKHPKAVPTKDNFQLEIIWTVIPTLLVLGMFYYGWVGYRPMRIIPKNAIPVKVTAKMWSWSFEYENGKWDSLLIVPVNKPVKLELFSPDVIHSLYIPAFRIKEDVVPGIANIMWFEANKTGTYNILCAEYCGQRHSYMLSKVKVLPQDEYEKWYNSKDTLTEKMMPGELVMKKQACIACHSTDGSRLVGPSFKGLYGSKRTVLVNGVKKEIIADDEYIKNSILDPNSEVVDGFPKGIMTNYKGQISEDEIKQFIEYIKTLKDD